MKKIVNLLKENNNVFMMDNDDCKLNIDGGYDIQKYEKVNDVKLDNMLIDFISNKDDNSPYKKGFDKIIKDIKEMAELNNIDYFAIGNIIGESDDTICIIFNINNRLATIDCELRVFYSSYNNRDEVQIEIIFSQGAGSQYGYNFFKYFNYDNYIVYLKPILRKYFESKEDKKIEKELIEYFVSDITNHIDYYYD